jgi:hypothetical protein
MRRVTLGLLTSGHFRHPGDTYERERDLAIGACGRDGVHEATTSILMSVVTEYSQNLALAVDQTGLDERVLLRDAQDREVLDRVSVVDEAQPIEAPQLTPAKPGTRPPTR